MRSETVARALLLGCASSAATVIVVVTVALATIASLAGGIVPGPGETAAWAVIVLTFVVHLGPPRLLLGLPLAILAAYRFNGGLSGVLATGASTGAALETAFSAAGYGVFPGNPKLVYAAVPVTALAGAAFAWPVWHRCVAPRRRADGRV